MSLIRSLFDYCFIILQSGTQNIRAEIQKMQNRVLRIIQIDLIDDRANKLFSKFITTRQSHEIIAQEIQDFLLQNSSRNNLKEMTKLTAGQEAQVATMIAEAIKKVKLEEKTKMDEVLEKLKTLGEENDALRVEFDQLKEKMTKLDG
ncbi:hypothetical protein BpHYR1_048475, partial [Brachionus plicatilis]